MTVSRNPISILPLLLGLACAGGGDPGAKPEEPVSQTQDPSPNQAKREVATFGAGCFWCVEAVLEQLDGIVDVASGYMGGDVEKPTYEQVCTGKTGHAEVVQVSFDPDKISFETLLDWFFKLHDPTTKDRQGNDVGPQYRSAVFWHSEAQRAATEKKIADLTAARAFPGPIVTEVSEAGPFYMAEDYHQDYYRQNRSQGYCRFVIAPKLEKLELDK